MMVRGDFLYVCPLCIELDLMMTSVSRLLQNKIYKLGHFKRKARDIDLCVILLASQLRLLASIRTTLGHPNIRPSQSQRPTEMNV